MVTITSLLPRVAAASTGPITLYSLGNRNAQVNYITTGPDGNLWFTDGGTYQIGKATPSGTLTENPVSCQGNPEEITTGPNGSGGTAIWATNQGCGLDMVDPSTFSITEVPIANAGYLQGIVAGPDGNIWFIDSSNALIERMNPSTHAVDTFPVGTAYGLYDLAVGPDGSGGTAIWFTNNFPTSVIGKINPSQVVPGTTSGITEYVLPLPGPGALSDPEGITAGPDGNIWWVERQAAQIGRMNPATHVIKQFPVPDSTPALAGGGPWLNDITVGPDGNLWWSENSGTIGRITTNGYITDVPCPCNAAAIGIVRGPAGTDPASVWYAFIGNDAATETPVSGVGRVSVRQVDVSAIAAIPKSDTVRTVVEGGKVSGTLATFKDADGNTNPGAYTATIDWGDGVTSNGTVSFSKGKFVVTGSHLYADEAGPSSSGVYYWYGAIVHITDSDGTSGGARNTIDVTDAALSATGRTVTLDTSDAFNGVLATFTDAVHAESASDYTATIDWGDGTTSTGTVALVNATKLSVAGSHSYTGTASSFTAHVTLTDVGGATATATTTVNDPS